MKKYLKLLIKFSRKNWSYYLFHLGNVILSYIIITNSSNFLAVPLTVLFSILLVSSTFIRKNSINRYILSGLALLFFVASVIISNIHFEVLSIYVFYLPIMYSFLLPDFYCPIIVGLIMSTLFIPYIGGENPTSTIILVIMYVMITSIFSSITSILSKKLKKVNSKLLQTSEKLQHMSTLDELTTVFNRQYFDIELSNQWRRSKDSVKPLSIIMIEIDYFKLYNNSYGHHKGHLCLMQVAHALNKTLRKSGDWIARYSSEEFAVVLPRTTKENAIIVAERLRSEVENLRLSNINSKCSKVVTISLGVFTVIPSQFIEIEELITSANKALSLSKKNGGNKVTFYDNGL